MDGAGQTSKPCCFDFIVESKDEEHCTETNMAETTLSLSVPQTHVTSARQDTGASALRKKVGL